jgi:hypothetical protein
MHRFSLHVDRIVRAAPLIAAILLPALLAACGPGSGGGAGY